jgi:hypothetical protein
LVLLYVLVIQRSENRFQAATVRHHLFNNGNGQTTEPDLFNSNGFMRQRLDIMRRMNENGVALSGSSNISLVVLERFKISFSF